MVSSTVSSHPLKRLGRIILILCLLYVFLVSISLMSHCFKGFGKGFAEYLIKTTANPFIGLFVGILATSVIQSSSTTTSMVVAFVASGALSVRHAIPIVMGANIGTTVTNTLVAVGHVTRREEFKRALGCSTVHDFFNLLTAFILLPIELSTHYLERSAGFLASQFSHVSGVYIQSPLKVIIKPAVHYVDTLFLHVLNLHGRLAYAIMLVFSLMLLFASLFYLVKIMKSLIMRRTEVVLNKILGSNAFLVITMGMLFTAIVQSSSVTTSILVPMVASGILTLETAFPITLGANIGTTVTAILASLTGNIAAITIAFAHLLFNITGILIFYPLRAMRAIPLRLATAMGELVYRKRRYAFIYVLLIFFVIPGFLIYVSHMIKW